MRRRSFTGIELSGFFGPSHSWRSTDTASCACLAASHTWLLQISIGGSWTAELLTMAPITGKSLDLRSYALSQ